MVLDLFRWNSRSSNHRGKITFFHLLYGREGAAGGYLPPKLLLFAIPCKSNSFFFPNSIPYLQDSNFGCILAELPDGTDNIICAEIKNLKIAPQPDNMYRMIIYSGFTDDHHDSKWTTPRYKQDYTWSEDYDRVSLDQNNCLTVASELGPFFPCALLFSQFSRAIDSLD